jgi:hypothetical protein
MMILTPVLFLAQTIDLFDLQEKLSLHRVFKTIVHTSMMDTLSHPQFLSHQVGVSPLPHPST